MPIKVRLVSRQKRGRVDAAELVTRRAEALRDHLGRALEIGISPIDGSARPRKPDGKPIGYRTGRLARGLRLGRIRRSRRRASVEVLTPRGPPTDEFRDAWVSKHDDVMTTEGLAGVSMREATADYLEELRNP
jgi:hypothetical protein